MEPGGDEGSSSQPDRTQSAPVGSLTATEQQEIGDRLKAKRNKKGGAKTAQLKPHRCVRIRTHALTDLLPPDMAFATHY
jgi:hypothetical protein